MGFSKCYPKPEDLIDNERKTLEYLSTRCHAGRFQHLELNANNTLDMLKASKLILNFNGEWSGRCQDGWFDIMVGVEIITKSVSEYSYISYCFAVRRDKEALRHFHFDYHPTHNGLLDLNSKLYNHPCLHLQYGGSRALQDVSDESFNALQPWLSSPRIPTPPVTLALLLDLGFREFHDEKIWTFRNGSEWRGLIKKNEDFILSRFYDACSEHLQSRKRDCLLMDLFYQ